MGIIIIKICNYHCCSFYNVMVVQWLALLHVDDTSESLYGTSLLKIAILEIKCPRLLGVILI